MGKLTIKNFNMSLEDSIRLNDIDAVREKIREALKAEEGTYDLSGISVMKICDAVKTGDITLDDINEAGLIFNLSQWTSRANDWLNKVKTNSRLQTKLKQLHRGFSEMYEAWSKGQLQNKVLKDDLNKKATKKMLALWQENEAGDENVFFEHVSILYKEYLGSLKDNWFFGHIDDEDLRVSLDRYFASAFSHKWEDTDLMTNEFKAMVTEYGIAKLFAGLKENKLNAELKKAVIEDVSIHIFKMLEQRKLKKMSALGICIDDIKERDFHADLRGALSFAAAEVVKQWIENDLDDNAYNELEILIKEYFPELVSKMEGIQIELFRATAFEYMIHLMRRGELDEMTMGKFKSFGQDAIDRELRLMRIETPSAGLNTSKLRDLIAETVINSIRKEWQKGTLGQEEAIFIGGHVLTEEKAINGTIEARVYAVSLAEQMTLQDKRIAKLEEQLSTLLGSVKGKSVNVSADYVPDNDNKGPHASFFTGKRG